jgi:hypothetical protein
MDGSKNILMTKTAWGSIIAVAATVAGMFGYHLAPADQTAVVDYAGQIIDIVEKIIAIAGALYAIYGRLMATQQAHVIAPATPAPALTKDPNEGGH